MPEFGVETAYPHIPQGGGNGGEINLPLAVEQIPEDSGHVLLQMGRHDMSVARQKIAAGGKTLNDFSIMFDEAIDCVKGLDI